MSTRLPNLSTDELAEILTRHGYREIPGRGRGSHRVFRDTTHGSGCLITVPLRRSIPRGTLCAILRSASIPRERLFQQKERK